MAPGWLLAGSWMVAGWLLAAVRLLFGKLLCFRSARWPAPVREAAASGFRPKNWSISLLVLLFGTSRVYLCTKQKDSAMLTALSSVVQFVLEVIILFGLVGILVAMNVEFAVGEWKRLKMSARLRLLRASLSARFLYRPSATIPCPQMPLMKTQRSISGV